MRWVGLLALLTLASLLIGFGVYILGASETTNKDHLMAWAKICVGVSILIFIGSNVRSHPR